MESDSGLMKRGILLFVFVGIIATAALYLALQPGQTPPAASQTVGNQWTVPVAVMPVGQFPGGVQWMAVWQANQHMPSSRGWEVRYNATITMGRLGEKDLDLGILREMLDEKKQRLNFAVLTDDGKVVTDVRSANKTVLNALDAFLMWHKKNKENISKDNADLDQVYEQIAELKNSENQVLRTEADKAAKILEIETATE